MSGDAEPVANHVTYNISDALEYGEAADPYLEDLWALSEDDHKDHHRSRRQAGGGGRRPTSVPAPPSRTTSNTDR